MYLLYILYIYIYKVLVIIVMSNCLHCINARNLSIHAARMQLYIYLDMKLFYCERDYNSRTQKIVYTYVSCVNTFS